MDYKIILKNTPVTDEIRLEVESKVEDLTDMSSTFYLTKFYIKKDNSLYEVKIVLSREGESNDVSSQIFKNKKLSIAMDQAKDSIIEEIMKELVMISVG